MLDMVLIRPFNFFLSAPEEETDSFPSLILSAPEEETESFPSLIIEVTLGILVAIILLILFLSGNCSLLL